MDRDVVSELIRCKKVVKTPPKKSMTPDARNAFSLRNDFTCSSEDGKLFEVFMRMNTELPFLFSIGLRYRSADGSITLCRYNGKHGHRNKIADRVEFDDFHIHKLYDVQLSDGTESCLDAEVTSDYASFDEALYAFLRDCGIEGWQSHFPNLENDISQFKIEGV